MVYAQGRACLKNPNEWHSVMLMAFWQLVCRVGALLDSND